jgi:hypothetical protein
MSGSKYIINNEWLKMFIFNMANGGHLGFPNPYHATWTSNHKNNVKNMFPAPKHP